VEEDERFFDFDAHTIGIGNEVGRQIATVETHALDQVESGFEAARFFDGDDAFAADFLHRVGENLADFFVTVGRDGGDLRHPGVVVDGARHAFDGRDGSANGGVDAALEFHRRDARGQQFDAFADNGAGQHGGGSGAVTGHITGLLGNFADELGADILEAIFEFNFFDDGYAVLGDDGGAEAPLQEDVAAFGSKRDARGFGHERSADDDSGTRPFMEFNYFGWHLDYYLRLSLRGWLAGAALPRRTNAARNVSIYSAFAIGHGTLFAVSGTCQDKCVHLRKFKQRIERSCAEALWLTLAAGSTVLMMGLGCGSAIGRQAPQGLGRTVKQVVARVPQRSERFIIAQDDDDSGDSDIAPSAVEKYVAIYRDMQQNRSLTVEQAAAKEGLSLAAFRDLEQKIEKDDGARQHVRDELQAAAQTSGGQPAPQATASK
jgi:hypothetical protein